MGQKVLAICLAVFTFEAEVHEAESDGGRGEVGEEGDVPQQLFLGRGPGDQGEDGGVKTSVSFGFLKEGIIKSLKLQNHLSALLQNFDLTSKSEELDYI